MTYARARGMRGLLDTLRFEPGIDIAFLEKDFFPDLKKGNLPSFHEFVYHAMTYPQILLELFLGQEVFFHRRYLIQKCRGSKEIT